MSFIPSDLFIIFFYLIATNLFLHRSLSMLLIDSIALNSFDSNFENDLLNSVVTSQRFLSWTLQRMPREKNVQQQICRANTLLLLLRFVLVSFVVFRPQNDKCKNKVKHNKQTKNSSTMPTDDAMTNEWNLQNEKINIVVFQFLSGLSNVRMFGRSCMCARNCFCRIFVFASNEVFLKLIYLHCNIHLHQLFVVAFSV